MNGSRGGCDTREHLSLSLSVIKSLGPECEMISYIMGAFAGQCTPAQKCILKGPLLRSPHANIKSVLSPKSAS
jgi:hypothetical protein